MDRVVKLYNKITINRWNFDFSYDIMLIMSVNDT